MAKLWQLIFVASLELFTRAIKQMEGQEISAVASVEKLKNLETMLLARQDGSFISKAVHSLFYKLAIEGSLNKEELINTLHCFYDTALSYLCAWRKHIDNIHCLHCFFFTKKNSTS